VRAPDAVMVTSLTTDVPLPSPAGRPLVWTATAQGGIGLQYEFWRLDASGWQRVQDYSASSTYTWTPGVSDQGSHALQAWVRSTGASSAYDAWASVTFSITAPAPVTVSALNTNVSLPARAGTPITWRATGSGGLAPLQYQFWRLDADGWHIVQAYSAANTYTWTPTGGQTGSHALQVWVRSAGSSAAYDAWSGVTFTIDSPPPIVISSFTANVAMPSTVGTPITWTASATGGAPPLEYQFWRLDADGWHIGQAYSPSASYTWTPGAGTEGTHAVQVWIRGVGPGGSYETWASTGFFTINP
jgi:hypothetical protein